jgi:hypothetical protein
MSKSKMSKDKMSKKLLKCRMYCTPPDSPHRGYVHTTGARYQQQGLGDSRVGEVRLGVGKGVIIHKFPSLRFEFRHFVVM